MPGFEVFDTVVLKENRALYGVVDRTYYNHPGPGSLEDSLIIAHVQVDPDVLSSFVRSGIPPRNHVYVTLAEVTQGSVLAREDQLELLDRGFMLGDFVKQDGNPMLGTILDFEESFVLQPVWKGCRLTDDGNLTVATIDDRDRRVPHVCTDACPVPVPLATHAPDALLHDLIPDVPGEEIKKATDLAETDIVVHDDWIGMVEELEQSVILLLDDNSIVVVHNSDELYVPIPDLGDKPLVALPEFEPDIPRPDVVVAQHGWSATIPFIPVDYYSGCLVVTNTRNLRKGRWLRGQWRSDTIPQGRIIDLKTDEFITRWLLPNPFAKTLELSISPPSSNLSLYDNMGTFPDRSELRRNKKLVSFDRSKVPQETEDRRRTTSKSIPPEHKSHMRIPTHIHVGDQVKFRDQVGAAVKYQGRRSDDGFVHGSFERVSPSDMFGFDVNILKVVASSQTVTVRWQDGTITKQPSRSLYKFDLFESDLTPSDIVVSREGMTQRLPSSHDQNVVAVWEPYNEMSVLEQAYELKPSKVGVLQSVDPQERVAQVRWFLKPDLRMLAQGNILSRDSRFGPLSEDVEDVSLYEVLSFPALSKRLHDFVILPPRCPPVTGLDAVTRCTGFIGPEPGMAAISLIEFRDRFRAVRGAASGIIPATSFFLPIEDAAYRSWMSLDWVGMIVGLGNDGNVTVRLNLGSCSKDVLVEHDQIIALIDEAALAEDDMVNDHDQMDWDEDHAGSGTEDSDYPSTIAEAVEYEGGHRLDDDSDDDNWDDADSEHYLSEAVDDTDMADDIDQTTPGVLHERRTSSSPGNANLVQSPVQQITTRESKVEILDGSVTGKMSHTLASLKQSLGSDQPSSFMLLEDDPPPDQYQMSKAMPQFPSSCLKRIMKEHKILANALPQGEIYVRAYENRLDLMRCLIIGPEDTPFEHAPFVIDLHFTEKFPREPPGAYFHSWTMGLGRINPNLYEEGKICLSLLGTWEGKSAAESWNEQATILQLLVSLQGLVFVRRPFYNEAGYEDAGAEDTYPVESSRYNERSFVMTRAFVQYALTYTVGGIGDILAWVYLRHRESPGLLSVVIQRANSLIAKSENEKGKKRSEEGQLGTRRQDDELLDGAGGSQGDTTKVFLKPLSRGAIVMLKKTIRALEEIDSTARTQ